MANATVLPTLSQCTFFQWSTVDSPNPALAASISSTDTTLTFTAAPLDENGVVVTEAFLMGIRNDDSYVETVYVPAGALSADGLTATGCVRGVRLTGIDWTTGDADLSVAFDAGAAVFCNITAVVQNLIFAALQGTIATGSSGLILGADADGTVTISRSTGVGTSAGWIRWNTSVNMVQFSNDGAAWVNISDSAASTIFKVSANDTTPGYLNGKLVAGTNTTLTENNDGGNETLQVNAAGTLASIVTNVTATATEVNRLSGISANVTSTNLNTLTAGASSSADSLHSHQTPALSGTAYEAISQYDAVAELPIEVQWYTQLTEVDTNLGDSNTRRRYAMKIVPSRSITDLTAINFRGKEAVNGATVGNLTVSIQTDSASAPSGTLAHANATIAISQATLRTWTASYATRTATFPGAVTLTAGTAYWLVFSMDATDAANYIKLGDASSYDENYLTFTRLTYNLDTTSWGSSSTVLPLFFWTTPAVSFGTGLCKTDADWGGRTWNFVGFSTAPAAANAACSYYYDTVPGLTGIPGKTYYLGTTTGALTATRPNGKYGNDFAYKIGKFIRNSDGTLLFKIQPGSKIIYGTNTQTSTTTENLIIWFAPGLLTMSASVGDANTAMSNGFYDMNTNNFVSSQSGYDNGTLLYQIAADAAGTPSSWQGVAADVSDIGVSVTHTELSGSEETYYIWYIQE